MTALQICIKVSVEVPNVKWSDIGGQYHAKQSLKEMVDWPLKFPNAFKRIGVKPPSGGILLILFLCIF
jgi:transitional endoplasmic reticulum ATPase